MDWRMCVRTLLSCTEGACVCVCVQGAPLRVRVRAATACACKAPHCRGASVSQNRDARDCNVALPLLCLCPQGVLGWLARDSFYPEFEAAAFDAPIGDVVRGSSPLGLHLIKVLEERCGTGACAGGRHRARMASSDDDKQKDLGGLPGRTTSRGTVPGV
jgi:hypothetical protein